jgi:hypothetical protein
MAAAVGEDHLVALGQRRDLKAPDVAMAEATGASSLLARQSRIIWPTRACAR